MRVTEWQENFTSSFLNENYIHFFSPKTNFENGDGFSRYSFFSAKIHQDVDFSLKNRQFYENFSIFWFVKFQQSIGCELISALTEQFSSAWRNAKFSITWDFHMRAKREFEKSGLRKLLEMTLTTLHHIATQDANFLQVEVHFLAYTAKKNHFQCEHYFEDID